MHATTPIIGMYYTCHIASYQQLIYMPQRQSSAYVTHATLLIIGMCYICHVASYQQMLYMNNANHLYYSTHAAERFIGICYTCHSAICYTWSNRRDFKIPPGNVLTVPLQSFKCTVLGCWQVRIFLENVILNLLVHYLIPIDISKYISSLKYVQSRSHQVIAMGNQTFDKT